MIKKYYLELAIVACLALLIIFLAYYLSRSLQVKPGQKVVIVKQNATVKKYYYISRPKISVNLSPINQKLDEVISGLAQVEQQLGQLVHELGTVTKGSCKVLVVNRYYNFTYIKTIDQRELALLLQYAQQLCKSPVCRQLDEAIMLAGNLLVLHNDSALQAAARDLLALKLLVVSHGLAGARQELVAVLNDLGRQADRLAASYPQLANLCYQIIDAVCRQDSAEIVCGFVLYFPGQHYSSGGYDVVVPVNLEYAGKLPFVEKVVQSAGSCKAPCYVPI
ncbi:MAG: hypothetical protein GXO42_00140 [bacterium]|nr:hypothetical protein [bacterium]